MKEKKPKKDKQEQKIAELEQKLSENEEKYLRCMADLQNVRRRAQEDRVDLIRNGSEQVIKNLLPALDNFDRALKSLPEDLKNNNWITGVVALEKIIFDTLKQEGLEEINTAGIKLDTNIHEAVMLDEKGESGLVIEVLEKGYLLNGKVLRPAKVKVGK